MTTKAALVRYIKQELDDILRIRNEKMVGIAWRMKDVVSKEDQMVIDDLLKRVDTVAGMFDTLGRKMYGREEEA